MTMDADSTQVVMITQYANQFIVQIGVRVGFADVQRLHILSDSCRMTTYHSSRTQPREHKRTHMDQQVIRTLADDDMQAVNQLIYQRLQSDVALVNQLAYYIISGGGKRIRPLIAVLSARALGYQGEKHVLLATIIEFIHTATLLHDDVVDESELRRGRDTANQLYGNAASVLVGDFLHTRAFQMMVELGDMEVMRLLSSATNLIAEGEVMQLMNCNDPTTSEESYLQVIYCKTAKLFEAATHCTAILASQSTSAADALRDYGKYLGTAFQLIDDVMDYSSDSAVMGKNVGDDLSEGKPTLPLIYAMAHGDTEQRRRIHQAITERDGMEHLDEILDILAQTHALEYTVQRAEEEAQKAIAAIAFLPDSTYKTALESLARIASQRNA